VSRFRWIRHLPDQSEPGPSETGGEQPGDRLAELQAQVASLSEELDWVRVENQRLSETMIIDLGSGLPNRVLFDADHLQAYARRRRSGETYSLLVVDIDHFLTYNDVYGEETGDEIIRLVGQAVYETIREGDRAYRYERDQFAVLLSGTSASEAVAAGERIRRRIEQLGIAGPESSGVDVLTVTVGIVEAGFRHTSAKEVLVEANRLVLEGKHAGRNQVVWPH
jgi:diguanylate cyclase (GGDEF)-like protein